MVDCHVVNLSGLLLAMTLYFTLSSGALPKNLERIAEHSFSVLVVAPEEGGGDDIYIM